MERYAFIDASNTGGVAYKILGFQIDWVRLLKFLKGEKWQCKDVFFYKGSRPFEKHQKQLRKLDAEGYIVRTKDTHIHPDKTKEIVLKCSKCQEEVRAVITTPGNRKSNCDVELTVDALELAGVNKEFLIFTGDGDFAYLIEKLIEKGVYVRIVSNTRRDDMGNKSFSTRLRAIIKREEYNGGRVSFIDINDWKLKIERIKEAAHKRDGFRST